MYSAMQAMQMGGSTEVGWVEPTEPVVLAKPTSDVEFVSSLQSKAAPPVPPKPISAVKLAREAQKLVREVSPPSDSSQSQKSSPPLRGSIATGHPANIDKQKVPPILKEFGATNFHHILGLILEQCKHVKRQVVTILHSMLDPKYMFEIREPRFCSEPKYADAVSLYVCSAKRVRTWRTLIDKLMETMNDLVALTEKVATRLAGYKVHLHYEEMSKRELSASSSSSSSVSRKP
jgi:hypothetical protein